MDVCYKAVCREGGSDQQPKAAQISYAVWDLLVHA